jgi:hypothetical protein
MLLRGVQHSKGYVLYCTPRQRSTGDEPQTQNLLVGVSRLIGIYGSLVAELAGAVAPLGGSMSEAVSIGSFVGTFRIDGFAWGSIDDGTRLVLSVFREL